MNGLMDGWMAVLLMKACATLMRQLHVDQFFGIPQKCLAFNQPIGGELDEVHSPWATLIDRGGCLAWLSHLYKHIVRTWGAQY